MPDVLGIIGSLLGGGNGLFVVLFGALIATVTAFLKGRSSGKASERARRDRDRLEAIDEAREIDDAIAGRDPDANRKELGRWAKRFD